MRSLMSAMQPATKWNMAQRRVDSIAAKPFVKWAGGKGQLVGEILRLFPEDTANGLTKYAEPFVGGGALLFAALAKHRFEQIYIGDVNAGLINAYKTARDDVEGLICALSEMQNAYLSADWQKRREYYYSARAEYNRMPPDAGVDKAALFIFLNKTCFNGLYRVNRAGQFNVPIGEYAKPAICDESNLRKVSDALQNVTIFCGDFSESRKFIDDKTLVYFDPPYRPISETAGFTAYSADCFNDDEQRRLARFVDEISKKGAKVILSNSDPRSLNGEDDFFEQLYGNYTISRVEATRMINSNSAKRGKISELLIYNY